MLDLSVTVAADRQLDSGPGDAGGLIHERLRVRPDESACAVGSRSVEQLVDEVAHGEHLARHDAGELVGDVVLPPLEQAVQHDGSPGAPVRSDER